MAVRRHYDLLIWLQGEIQHYLPHEIMLAAWGNFRSNLIYHDIVSALVGVRTEHANPESLSPLLQGLFNRWVELGKTPYALSTGESGFLLEERGLQCSLGAALQGMQSLLMHGVCDARGQRDCIYMIFSSKRRLGVSTINAISVLLPYLDIALSRITPLPGYRHPVRLPRYDEDYGLSNREIEIVHWIKAGKTNSEIAAILGIGIFTVKNHLHSIFKKMQVCNHSRADTTSPNVPPDDR